ncbi:MAG: hypothetical protein KDB25_07385 [Leucobacter sp.]|nr:hypothetical protein [Leucobacter sp.]
MVEYPQFTELETELRTMRRAGSGMLGGDMWEKWASPHVSDEENAAHDREQARLRAEHADAVERLESRVRELRSSAPEVVRAWALAHFRMLADFINENEAIPESATAVSVAQGEQREWMRVHDGELAYVVQNVFYVPIDAGVYEREFGLIP